MHGLSSLHLRHGCLFAPKDARCERVIHGGAGSGGEWLLGSLEVRSSAADQRMSFACGRCLPGDGSLTELLPGAALFTP